MALREDLIKLLRERDAYLDGLSTEFVDDLTSILEASQADLKALVKQMAKDGHLDPTDQLSIEEAQQIRAILKANGFDDVVDDTLGKALDKAQEQLRRSILAGQTIEQAVTAIEAAGVPPRNSYTLANTNLLDFHQQVSNAQ